MRDCKIAKKALSVLLALSMVLSWTPIPTHAADADSCAHHTEHTADCGYVAAVAGSPCTHVCGEACVESCVHSVHDDTCGYIAGSEGTPCAYDCQEDHGTVTDQPEATTEPSVPETTEDAVPEATEDEIEPVCTCGTDDSTIHATDCPLYVAPENPACTCVERCTEETPNVWCDVCGFDHAACEGEDTVTLYDDGCVHEAGDTTTVANGICSICNVYGWCGTSGSESSVSWTFGESTGTLTISGSGAIANYNNANNVPWNAYSDKIVTLDITGDVTSLGTEKTFYNCTSLTTAKLGKSVNSVSGLNFWHCTSLTQIVVDSNNATYKSIDGVLYSADGKTLVRFPTGKAGAYTISDGVDAIGDDAFYNCNSLASITMPNSVTKIGDFAFSLCYQLDSVILPSGLTSIGKSAFRDCTSLSSIVIPANVGNIGLYAFGNCPKLSSIKFLGATEPTIGSGALSSGSDALVIYVPCAYEGTTFGGKTVTKSHFEVGTGTSIVLSYSDSGDSIVQHCSQCGDCGTATITVADNLVYDGTNKVSVTYSTDWLGGKLDVTPAEAINADTYTASITHESATATKEFTIAKKPLTVTANDQIIIYGGSIAEGVAQISGDLATGDSFSEVTLKPSTSNATTNGTITPSAVKIVNASDKDVTANYDITYVPGHLTINKSAPVITFNADYVPSKTYNGEAVTIPTVENITVSTKYDGSVIFTWYKDTVADGNKLDGAPVNAGTYILMASIADTDNNSAATKELTVKIAQANASGAVVTVTGTYSYTSKEITPDSDEVTVTLDGKTLTHGTDYTFTASNNIEVGTDTAIVTITFKGNYTGTATGKFTIAECPHSVFEDKKCTQCGGICGNENVVDHNYDNGICVNGCYQPAELVDNVYQIGNAGQLYWFAGLVNGTLSDKEQDTAAHAVLTADITMPANKNWTPIGGLNNWYGGTFDGKNHTIAGLSLLDENANYIGLFGAIMDSTVQNLGIVNVMFSGNANVGGISGFSSRSTLLNCYVTGSVSATNTVGGLIGEIYHDTDIQNCYFYGDVSIGTNAGKIIGLDDGAICTNCYYLATSDTHGESVSGTTAKTFTQFASGEVAYLLNGTNAGTDAGVWKQIIGTDSYPTFTGNTVYRVTDCKGGNSAYSNDSTATGVHNYVNGTCTICGDTIELISVDITWGAMEFTYTDGAWNAETHSYGEGSWSDNGTGWVNVKNSGNVAVTVTYDYGTERTDIFGSFTDGTNAITASVTLPAGEEKKAWLILNGKPSTALNGETIGTVTVTIGR